MLIRRHKLLQTLIYFYFIHALNVAFAFIVSFFLYFFLKKNQILYAEMYINASC